MLVSSVYHAPIVVPQGNPIAVFMKRKSVLLSVLFSTLFPYVAGQFLRLLLLPLPISSLPLLPPPRPCRRSPLVKLLVLFLLPPPLPSAEIRL